MKLWQDKIRRVTPYTPGEQPKKARMVKLNTNENPYPPSPLAAEAIRRFDTDRLRLYPDPAMTELVEALAAYHGVAADMVFAGVGSDDVIAMAFQTYFNSDKPILFPDVTYSFYSVWAELFGIPYARPKLDAEFRIDASAYFGENGGIIIPNPNAPTSIYEPLESIEEILRHNRDVVVIIDEAYIDFAGASALELVDTYDNLLVVRTFSKSRSMAGMRIGYAIGCAELIKALNDVKYSFNSYTLNQLSIAAGAASLKDEAYFAAQIEKIKATRAKTAARLKDMGFVFPEPAANFIFARHPQRRGEDLLAFLRERDIYVRHFKEERIREYLRITIGTEEEMEQLFCALAEYQ